MNKIISAPYRSWLALIFLVAALFVLLRIVLPAFSEVKALFNEKGERQAKLIERETRVEELRAFAARFNSLDSAKRSQINAAIPPDLDFSDWLAALEGIGARSGVYIDVLEQKGSVENSSGEGVEFVARVRGNYSNLRLFLSMLGQNIRLTDIRDLRLESSSATERDPMLQANLTLAIYYQP